jgi:2-polyprenyl-6-methoxyphenol hydroxylase-like FAD-dependent oxidoreductase
LIPTTAAARQTDVAIIGGGPAGIAAALTLLRYTKHRVTVIEGTHYQSPRVGEMVSSAVFPLLDYLGVGQKLASGYRMESFSYAAAWGGPQVTVRDFMMTGRGTGWCLDRQQFDAALAEYVPEEGGTLLLDTWLRSASFQDGVWHLRLNGNSALSSLVAEHVIDATGRRAAFARYAGAQRKQHDGMVGVVGYFSRGYGEFPQLSLVEAVCDGWWYSAVLPGRRVVAAFMTDIENLRSYKLAVPVKFCSKLSCAVQTAARLEDAALQDRPFIFPAQSQVLEPCIGTGWVAAGDAASAFDPLSSLGIGHAFASGIQAARIVDQRIRGTEELALQFQNDVKQNVDQYILQRRMLYALENRWPGSQFWAQRKMISGDVE